MPTDTPAMGAAAERLDLVVMADPRPRFAEGRCLAALLATAARAGYRAALLPVLSPLPAPARPFHPAVSALLAAGEVALLDGERAHEAGLLLVHHLPAARHPRPRPLALRAERVVLRVDQPWRAPDGTPLVGIADTLRNAAELCGRASTVACADAVLRADLAAEGVPDAELWPPTTLVVAHARAVGERRRVGRHVAGGGAAWPDAPADLLAAYSPGAGTGTVLAEAAARSAPSIPGCRLDAAELGDPAAFLASLDAYVLATGDAWRPSLLPGLAEALAGGAPLVASPALEPLLGPAATYARPAEVGARLRDVPPGQREAARELHEAATSPAALLRRLDRHLGPPPRGQAPRLTLRRDLRAPRRALFLSPNGIGMGHLTRLLAVARRCAPDLEPVFLSMSQAVGVVRRFGYHGEYVPFHAHTGEGVEAWRAALAARLSEAVAFHDPRVVVFDGNVPYQGLVDCRLAHPDRPFVWIRRGLWRQDAGRATIDRARHFDLVIEPGELASALDPGPTAGRRAEALQVPPVLLLDPDELPDRATSRAELGLDPARTAVLVQLGSRNNFDYAGADRVILDELGSRPDVELVVVDWLIGEGPPPPLPPRVRRISDFPVARRLRAFDLAVSAAGYNSFHELLACGVPTVFAPNEHPSMDAQELRALWAERNGLALLARQRDPYRLAWAVTALLDPARRAALAGRCRAALPPCDGAAAVAARVLELSAAAKLSRHPDRLPHALTRAAALPP